MRIEDLFEDKKQKLSEAQPAGVLGTGLDPAQFNSRYGVSPANASRTVNNIVRLNPQFRTPQFRNAVTSFMMDNPKALQAANQNFANLTSAPKAPPSKGSRLGMFARTALGKAFGVLGMLIDPTTPGDGTIDPEQHEAWNQAEKFLDHLVKNNPQQLIDLIDAENTAQDKDDPNFWDMRQDPRYQQAQNAVAAGYVPPPLINPANDNDSPPNITPRQDPPIPNRVAPPPLEIPSNDPPPDITIEPPTPKPQQTPRLPVDPVSPTGPLVIPPGGPKTDPGGDPKELPKDDPNAPPLDIPDFPGGPEITPQKTPGLPVDPSSPTGPKELPKREPPKTDPERGPVEFPTDNPVAPPLDAPKTFPGPGLGIDQGTDTGIIPVPRAGTGGNTRGRGGRGRGRGRGEGDLPLLGLGGRDAVQMQFQPINIRDPLNLKRFG